MSEDPTENEPLDVAEENYDLFLKDACCQTDMKMAEIEELELKYRDAESKLDRLSFSENSLKHDDKKVSVYTGLPNFLALSSLFDLLEPCIPESSKSVLTKFQQLLILLIRLRLYTSLADMAYRFDVSTSTVSRAFLRMLEIAYVRLSFLIKWPGRDEIWKTTPIAFRQHFGTKVAVVIDCFEIFIEQPLSLLARAQTFSSYKHHNTVKFLIGIAPQGVITFISEA